MAYETGTATSVVDLLDKIRVFAAAQGWTVNRDVAAGSGRELCLSKGSAYFNMRGWQNESANVNNSSQANKYGIGINGSDGFNGANAWDRQPGYPIRNGGTAGTDQGHAFLPLVTNFGPFPAYHLFAPDSKTIYLELEVTTGVFQRLGFGSLDLFHASTPGGGRFFYATTGRHVTDSVGLGEWLGGLVDNSNTAQEEVPFRHADYDGSIGACGSWVRCAFDSFDGWASSGRTASNTIGQQACQGGGVHDKILRDSSPNPLNGVALMLPNIVAVNRGNEFLSPVGVVPGIRYMDMTNYLPGDEFTLGPDTWKVFPWYQKNGRSLNRGIAYKKVV